ncbi:hypothetical protein AB0N99_07670 [Streptomyces sp. NPDC093272]|uniref:hypothetical protein n=1 Tax=Streptomyces sp. NPDC093272 TaxID=3154981 RepID=UPI00341ACBE9
MTFSELRLAYERGNELETQRRIVCRSTSQAYRAVLELAVDHLHCLKGTEKMRQP